MKNAKVKRRYITLIEIIIVMFLIALITGVIAYNYRGSLDEGKAFKTRAAIEKLQTILNLQAAEDPTFLEDIQGRWENVVKKSPLVHNADALIRDGWGDKYQVEVDESGSIRVKSQKYEDYLGTHPESMFKK